MMPCVRMTDPTTSTTQPFNNPTQPTQPTTHPTTQQPERVVSDELALCCKAYQRLTAQSLAGKLGLASPGEAVEGACLMGRFV